MVNWDDEKQAVEEIQRYNPRMPYEVAKTAWTIWKSNKANPNKKEREQIWKDMKEHINKRDKFSDDDTWESEIEAVQIKRSESKLVEVE